MKCEKCDHCNNKADYNFQENWCIYIIDEKGEYELHKMTNTGDNIFLCEKCARKEKYI